MSTLADPAMIIETILLWMAVASGTLVLGLGLLALGCLLLRKDSD